MRVPRVRLHVSCISVEPFHQGTRITTASHVPVPPIKGDESHRRTLRRNKQQERKSRGAIRGVTLRGLVAEAQNEVRYALLTMKVLLLHPTEGTRSELAAQLRAEGADVHCLSSGEELLGAVAEGDAGVAVVHLCSPSVRDGMALLSQCRAIDAQLPLIALSERDDAATAVEAAPTVAA